MSKIKKYIFGLLVITILLLSLVYFSLHDESKDKNNSIGDNNSDNSVVNVLLAVIFPPEYKISENNLQRNAEVPFKQGEKFVYNLTWNENICERNCLRPNTVLVFEVENYTTINGRNCYIISAKYNGHFMMYYYDSKTGDILMIKEGNREIEWAEEARSITFDEKGLPFLYWMLSLKDNFTWEEHINVSGGGRDYQYINKYVVVGKENVNNRTCFKVEIVQSSENITMEIDVEKRIVVKKKVRYQYQNKNNESKYYDFEANLISEI